jgi:hypothetical protein
LMILTLSFVYTLHRLLFVLLLSLLVFVNLVCPYWLIRIQEYKFEINGPWDEAKLCFDITDWIQNMVFENLDCPMFRWKYNLLTTWSSLSYIQLTSSRDGPCCSNQTRVRKMILYSSCFDFIEAFNS